MRFWDRIAPWIGLAIIALCGAVLWAFWPDRQPPHARELPPRDIATAPTTPPPPANTAPGVAYVGDAACARCHAEIAETFARHPMGRSMAPAAEVMPEVLGEVFQADGLTYAIDRRDGRVFHQEIHPDGTVIEEEARYALGSGTRGFAFLVDRGGGLYESPISWYTQIQQWGLSPGYRNANLHFDRPITRECLFCHVNQAEPRGDRGLVIQGLTIGCERCHGPGALHVRHPMSLADGPPNIVNPARLDPPLREDVCNQCHLQGVGRTNPPGRSSFDYRPGLPLSDFIQVPNTDADPVVRNQNIRNVEQMRSSRCYLASKGQLGCISCHDPHRKPMPAERVAFYRDRCLRCHADPGCSLPLDRRLATIPDDDCTACHMPRRTTTDIEHTSVVNHSIPRHADPTPR